MLSSVVTWRWNGTFSTCLAKREPDVISAMRSFGEDLVGLVCVVSMEECLLECSLYSFSWFSFSAPGLSFRYKGHESIDVIGPCAGLEYRRVVGLRFLSGVLQSTVGFLI